MQRKGAALLDHPILFLARFSVDTYRRCRLRLLCPIERIKSIAVELLAMLKAEKLRIDHWVDKGATRDAVRLAIQDFLWSDAPGLPIEQYSEDDVQSRANTVYLHVYRAYPTRPSPYYQTPAA